jgi:outer membrane protein OmpA-like peptidoglycan-associated protein
MPVPGGMNGSSDPASAERVPTDGDFAELRALLVGPEQRRLDELEHRLHDPESRVQDLGEYLPQAIELRSKAGSQLRKAMDPILEQSFRASVKRNPEVLAEALYPAIGSAIRKAVAAALEGMVQTLNQMLEKSVSPQSFAWRLEALRTGRSYGEVMLTHSVRYAVEQVFLIHRDTGLLLAHVEAERAVVKDADLVSGMLTAIQDFVRDSFGAGSADGIEQMQVGEFNVWVQQGPRAILAGVIRGVPPMELKSVFQRELESVHQSLSGELQDFQGDTEPFSAAEPQLRACLLGRSLPQTKPERSWALLAIGVLLAVVLAAWGFLAIRDQLRWKKYLDALKREPGIVVTSGAQTGGRFEVHGLRDPLSRDPLSLAGDAGLDAARVDLHLDPYFSVQPRFANVRNLEIERAAVENAFIHFDSGSARLTDLELDRLDDVVRHLNALFDAADATGRTARVEVVGHTDSSGVESSNVPLSEQRAMAVVTELHSAGIKEDRFSPRGVSDKQPVRNGSSQRDQAYNRSVSFRILIQEK